MVKLAGKPPANGDRFRLQAAVHGFAASRVFNSRRHKNILLERHTSFLLMPNGAVEGGRSAQTGVRTKGCLA